MQDFGDFIFRKVDFQRSTGTLTMSYAYQNGPEFTEKVHFKGPFRPLFESENAVLERLFRLIFLMAGISYYKAAIPPRLVCEAFALDGETAAFCQKLYFNGLGEFAYRNKVNLDFHFDSTTAQGALPISLNLPHRALVPVGGGKDSIVTIETLKKAGMDVSLFALGGAGDLADPIRDTIEMSGLPFIHVRRVLCPNLIELNKQGALNGHVPITAILSGIAAACAVLYGFDAVVLSNEGSSNAPNLVVDGCAINHQYSKSAEFEKDFAELIRQTITPDLHSFSFLRPLSETAIASRFAKLGTTYFDVFRSCNTAFRQDESKRGKKWCCDCPKCRFVFLALAPFMDKEKLVSIFGSNMLNDPAQLEGFKELCGLSAFKPFECVGEVQESALLMLKLAEREEWAQDCVVKQLASTLASRYPDAASQFDKLLQTSNEHFLPKEFRDALG